MNFMMNKNNGIKIVASCVCFILLMFTQVVSAQLKDGQQYLSETVRLEVLVSQLKRAEKNKNCSLGKASKTKACLATAQKEFEDDMLNIEEINERVLELVEPTVESTKEFCSKFPDTGKDWFEMTKTRCLQDLRGQYFQELALIKQGIEPAAYKQGQIGAEGTKILAGTELDGTFKEIKETFSQLQALSQKSYVTYEGSWICEAPGQKIGKSRPDCRYRPQMSAPEGFQVCKLEKKSVRTAEDADVDKWNVITFKEDSKLPRNQRRIKAYSPHMWATGGPWHDQYMSKVTVSNVVLSIVPEDFDVEQRKQNNCTFVKSGSKRNGKPPKPILPSERWGLYRGIDYVGCGRKHDLPLSFHSNETSCKKQAKVLFDKAKTGHYCCVDEKNR